MIEKEVLKAEERAVFSLRSLYRKYGYRPYKMRKFEEYDFYMRNKDFLVSDSIITFTDRDGTLLALKPDVTLSIIKDYQEEKGTFERVCYNENVYRISGDTDEYREILQTGLECMGETDIFTVLEVLKLAAESLKCISENFVLEISHMGLLFRLFAEANAGEGFEMEMSRLINNKNAHEIPDLCKKYGIPSEITEKFYKITRIYGNREKVLKELELLFDGMGMEGPLNELKTISDCFTSAGYGHEIRFDFSIVNNMKYYNGIVFKGYVEEVPEGILAGGQYDGLMERFGHKAGGIGFAVYLDALDSMEKDKRKSDVDTVILYNEKSNIKTINEMAEKIRNKGKTVVLEKQIPNSLRYSEIIDMKDGEEA